MNPGQRALTTAALFALGPAFVVGVILFFGADWEAGLASFVVVAAAGMAWARWAADRLVAARIGGREADPSVDARLCNLVEGLSTSAGVRQPRLVVVDSPGLNALAAGTTPARAVLAVTTALMSELDRMELEAVLAEELYLIRHNETLPGTVLVATFGWGRKLALTSDRDQRADLGAVSLTRYPPALASALEKIEAKGSVVPGQPGFCAHLWLADPRPPAGASPSRGVALHGRIEALREL